MLGKLLRQYSKRQLMIGFALVVGFLILLLLSISVSSRDPDRNVGTGPEYSDPSGPALLKNATKLYEEIDDPEQFRAIAQDVGVFAKINELDTGNDSSYVYTVKSYSIEDKTLRINGMVNAHKDEVSLVVSLLNFGKIKTSITSGQLVSEEGSLPSSAKENQFIGSLPLKQPGFSIDYFVASKRFSIQAFIKDPAIEARAIEIIENGMGRKLRFGESIFFAAL